MDEKNLDKKAKWSEYSRNYYKENRKKCIKSSVEYEKRRRKVDHLYKLRRNLKTYTYHAIIKNNMSEKRILRILGATYPEVRKHIEDQFVENMSWDNYGEWHIDHIIPLSSAKTEEEMLALSKFNNLQPLWAKDNIAKSNKI